MWNNIRYSIPLHLLLRLTNWFPDNLCFIRLRGWLAHFFFNSCGKNFRIGRNVTFYNPSEISFGNNVYVAYGCWFSAGSEILVDDEVVVGPYNVFASSNHTKVNGSFRYGPPKNASIYIGPGSWIGAHCTITAGTNIGAGACIGANSVVVSSVKSDSLYAGSPAKYIKEV